MTEHRRNIWVTNCMEANAWYHPQANPHYTHERGPMYAVIAEAYLMR